MKRFWKCCMILGVAAVFCAACEGQVPADPQQPVTISGTVRDPSGEPAAGVRVSVHPGHYPDMPDYAEGLTDKTGRYEMVLHFNPLPGSWKTLQGIDYILARDSERNLAASHVLNRMQTNMDLDMEPGITLSGVVKDTKGAPVTNALVDLYFVVNGPPHSSPYKLGPRPLRVNEDGSFSIPALPRGREYCFFDGITAPGFGTASDCLGAKDAKTNHYTFPVVVLKTSDRKLAGQVVDSDKKPVGGAQMSISGAGQPDRVSNATTDREGHFAFEGLCEGSLKIFADYEGPTGNYVRLNGSSGMEVQAGDTNLVLQLHKPKQGGIISGP